MYFRRLAGLLGLDFDQDFSTLNFEGRGILKELARNPIKLLSERIKNQSNIFSTQEQKIFDGCSFEEINSILKIGLSREINYLTSEEMLNNLSFQISKLIKPDNSLSLEDIFGAIVEIYDQIYRKSESSNFSNITRSFGNIIFLLINPELREKIKTPTWYNNGVLQKSEEIITLEEAKKLGRSIANRNSLMLRVRQEYNKETGESIIILSREVVSFIQNIKLLFNGCLDDAKNRLGLGGKEELIIDYNNSRIFHTQKVGVIKVSRKSLLKENDIYKPGKNILNTTFVRLSDKISYIEEAKKLGIEAFREKLFELIISPNFLSELENLLNLLNSKELELFGKFFIREVEEKFDMHGGSYYDLGPSFIHDKEIISVIVNFLENKFYYIINEKKAENLLTDDEKIVLCWGANRNLFEKISIGLTFYKNPFFGEDIDHISKALERIIFRKLGIKKPKKQNKKQLSKILSPIQFGNKQRGITLKRFLKRKRFFKKVR